MLVGIDKNKGVCEECPDIWSEDPFILLKVENYQNFYLCELYPLMFTAFKVNNENFFFNMYL